MTQLVTLPPPNPSLQGPAEGVGGPSGAVEADRQPRRQHGQARLPLQGARQRATQSQNQVHLGTLNPCQVVLLMAITLIEDIYTERLSSLVSGLC